jgi:hypothetical protein
MQTLTRPRNPTWVVRVIFAADRLDPAERMALHCVSRLEMSMS